MYTRLSVHIPVLLLSAVLVSACGDTDPVSPTPITATSALVTAEPMTAAPEFLPLSFCPNGPPFAIRLLITIGSGGDIVVVRRVRFDFTDRFGDTAVPVVARTSTGRPESTLPPVPVPVPLPTSSPVNIPSSAPIPIPDSLPFQDTRVVPGDSSTVPTVLHFGCGVDPNGTLIVSVDTTDSRGASGTSQVRVRVGR
jgi:hypothetical protein